MTDRVEKTIEMRAPVDKVWRALTDSAEFSQWFGVDIREPFVVGAVAHGHITNKGYEHLTLEATIVKMEKPRLFAFTWHPYAIDPKVDYSGETPTLVEFHLEPTREGTRVRVVETGFEALPSHRRPDALKMNDRGWATQAANLKAHVES